MNRRQIMLVFYGVMLGMLLAALDQTIVATALPRIVTQLHGFEHLSWVVTAYLLTSTVTVPVYGKLSDLYGRRKLFAFAILIFLVGSALSGLAQNMTQLIVFRGVQGLGAGGMIPIAIATIGDIFSPRERGRYQGYTGAVFASASIIGPLAGGWLTDHATWRWIFYINLPLGAVALFVIWNYMHVPFERREHRIDYPGVALMTAFVVCLLLVAVWGGTTYPWGSPVIIGLALAGVVGAVLFVWQELRAPEPALPMGMFRESIVSVGDAAALVLGAGMFGAIVYIPVFMQRVIGTSATNSGVVLIPLMLGWVVSSVLTGRAITRFGRYKGWVVSGTIVMLVGFWLLTRLNVASGTWDAVIAMVIIGVGMGQMFQTYVLAIQNAVPRSDLGVATASNQWFRSIGATFGTAVFGTLLVRRLTDELTGRLGSAASGVDVQGVLQNGAAAAHGSAPTATADIKAALAASLHTVFLAGFFVMLIGLVLAFLLKEIPLRTVSHVREGAETAPVPDAQSVV